MWAPRHRSWWIGVLFAIGSTCFVVGPFPGFVHLVGAVADAAVFFAGSIFFTSAATLQFLDTPRSDRIDRWASAIQFVGTLFFNLSTGRALHASIDLAQEDTPDLAARRVRVDLLPRRQRARVVRSPRRARSRLVDRGDQPGRLDRLRRLGGGRLHRARDGRLPGPGRGERQHGRGRAVLPGRRPAAAGGRRAHPQRPSTRSRWRPHDPHPLFARPARAACVRHAGRRRRRRSITGRSRTRG